MNDKKIAFIIAVNNEQYFEECCFYIHRLSVPAGYDIDIIAIREADSMCAAYNAGMNNSDAKYKVYMHQDVMIRNVQFIENIIRNICNNCETIKLVQPNSEESKIIGNKTFLVEKNKKRIICYPIERKLLYCISKISKKEKIIKDEYFLINQTLSDLINVGNNINTVEVIRDFNGYSWTTIPREIESIKHNLVYQNLRMILGTEFINNWLNNREFIIDYIELLNEKLNKTYGKKITEEFLDVVYKLSILLDFRYDKKAKENK